MRIAIAQLNSTVGDIAGNTRLVLDAIQSVEDHGGADVMLCPEMMILGYPPRDLILREDVVAECERALHHIAERVPAGLTVIVGHPRRVTGGSRPAANCASVIDGGEIIATYDKRLLPGYDVFDEDRYFQPGTTNCIVEVAGTRAGVLICEDLWRAHDVEAGDRVSPEYRTDPARELAEAGCSILFVLSASPFTIGKGARHLAQLQEIAKRLQVSIVLVNQIGGNDDLVFDGRSAVIDTEGLIRSVSPAFESEVRIIDLDEAEERTFEPPDEAEEIFGALVRGVRDYCTKTEHGSALLGVSGGLDSSLVATIAVAAIGAKNITGVMLPSRYSSEGSRRDAARLAENLGLGGLLEAGIEPAHAAVRDILDEALGGACKGVTDENVQARLRAVILMGLANDSGALLLSTSNKSEMAVGYTTLYGDMSGALAVIADVLKTKCYDLARWINARHAAWGFTSPPIPDSVLEKPPSAELRPNQTDQDSLPPYEQLDMVIHRYVDMEQSADRIVAETELDEAMVRGMTRQIDRFEYKRFQAAVVLKVTGRAFGPGRPMPIVMKSSAIVPQVVEAG